MDQIYIHSTGAYVPEQVLTNQYFDDYLNEDVSTWLEEKANIYQRHWCKDEESTADLCIEASKVALERADLTAETLDLIIIATDTPEFISPATAAVVQHRLGAIKAGVFDLNAACAGFVTALDVATNYLKANPRFHHILVVGAYAMSKYLNKDDKKTVTLFADGAGAVILSRGNNNGKHLGSYLYAQGHYFDGMGIYAGGTKNPISKKTIDNKDHLLKFIYKYPPDLNKQEWTKMILELCSQAGLKPEEIDRFFITQINVNSISQTMEGLNLSKNKAHVITDRYGYTGSACIPMALDDALQRGLVEKGNTVFFISSGGGLVFAASAFIL